MQKSYGHEQASSIFVTPRGNSHPHCTPVRVAGSSAESSGTGRSSSVNYGKGPKAPDKPLAPYMRYSRRIWESVRAANPELKLADLGKVIGQQWRELPPHQKQQYQEEFEMEKVKYAETLKMYHNSAAYQQYITTKDRAQKDIGQDVPLVPPTKKHQSQQLPRVEPRVSIQPCDDDNEAVVSDYISLRQLAHNRFLRNQKLLAEVFSESGVPDLRSLVTNQRMTVLKKQVHSLNMHQKKLEHELEQLEEKFESKRRKIEDSSVTFNEKFNEFSYPAVPDEKYVSIVETAKQNLISRYQQYKKQNETGENGNGSDVNETNSEEIDLKKEQPEDENKTEYNKEQETDQVNGHSDLDGSNEQQQQPIGQIIVSDEQPKVTTTE